MIVFSSCSGMLHFVELSMVLVSQAANFHFLPYMDRNSKSSWPDIWSRKQDLSSPARRDSQDHKGCPWCPLLACRAHQREQMKNLHRGQENFLERNWDLNPYLLRFSIIKLSLWIKIILTEDQVTTMGIFHWYPRGDPPKGKDKTSTKGQN